MKIVALAMLIVSTSALAAHKVGKVGNCTPNGTPSCADLAKQLEADGQHFAATAAYEKGCQLYDMQSCVNFATSKERDGDFDSAKEALDKATSFLEDACSKKNGTACGVASQIYLGEADLNAAERTAKLGCDLQAKIGCDQLALVKLKISKACAADETLVTDESPQTAVRIWTCNKDGKKNGKNVALFKPFSTNGFVIASKSYKAGVADGPYFKRGTNGKEIESGNYHNGEKVGVWKYTATDGTVREESDQDRNIAAQKVKDDEKLAADQEKAAERKEKALEAENKRKALAEAYCQCKASLVFYNAQVDHENNVGKVSGFVNATNLQADGQVIVSIHEFLDSFKRTPAGGDQCHLKATMDVVSSCLYQIGQWKSGE